jgi:lysophospholipase
MPKPPQWTMKTLFHELPGNPAPENASTGRFTTSDGKSLRYACFLPSARPFKGTVVVLPGRNECIEKYFETISDLTARGLGVAIFDWRGQGASVRLIKDPQRGYVRSFFDYANDLDQFFTEIVLPDCRGPYYVLAHSAGALVALLAAPSMANRVRRMVLIAPFLMVTGVSLTLATIRRLATALYYLGFGRFYVTGGPRPLERYPFASNKLTSDPARYARNCELYEAHPNLGLGGPTVAWIRAAAEASVTVQDPDFLAKIQTPILIVAAGADEVVANRPIEDLALRLRNGSLLTIDGARHEILQEADIFREQFFAAFDAFVPGSGG